MITASNQMTNIQRALNGAGFKRLPRRPGWRRGAVKCRLSADWAVFAGRRRSAVDGELFEPMPRQGGLAKPVVRDGLTRREVHLPLAAMLTADEDDAWAQAGESDGCQGAASVAALVSAAADWVDGRTPAEVSIPPRDQVEAMVTNAGAGGLTVQVGPYMQQGRLIHGPDELALRLSIATVPDELDEVRRYWLRQTLIDASRVPLVRVGIHEEHDQSALAAQVDLTGVPTALLENMIRISLASLRWAYQWLVKPAAFILDASSSSRALEAGHCGIGRESEVTRA